MINLYYHGGSFNHGCEAIVRSTSKILGTKPILYTKDLNSDELYKLDQIVDLKLDSNNPPKKTSLKYFFAALSHKIRNDDYLFIKYSHLNFFSKIKKNHVYLSIGGDNYCYSGKDILGYYNEIIHKKGAKTILWGCSFEPTEMTDKVAKDIEKYDLIITRESLSYECLKKVNNNTYLFPDPAFQLNAINLHLPKGFVENNTVGINVSPLIIKNEIEGGITFKNYCSLLEYIINNTEMQIALIPHVVEKENDDREPLNKLFDLYEDTGRVVLINDCNAEELKGYISRCRFFVGARTHATIAAYSTCVPTLVVGYSIKAKGIAKDIFGTYENYVVPVQSLKNSDDLKLAFKYIFDNETEIKTHLHKIMPQYCEKSLRAAELVKGMLKI